MAYVNTQLIENLQVQNLIFIPANNVHIPAGYGMYINAEGQTYWAQTLNAASLTAFSTSINHYIDSNDSTLQGQIYTQSTQINNQSSAISTLNGELNSLSTFVYIQVSSVYYSTTYILLSTLYGFSTFSSFFVQIDALELMIQGGLSTLSTTISVENASTYNTLLRTINYVAQSSFLYTDQSISSLSSVVAYASDLNEFSTLITDQLNSSISGLTDYIDVNVAVLTGGLENLGTSTVKNQVDILKLQRDVSSLQIASTSMSTVVNGWISSYVQISQGLQDIYIYRSISSLSTVIANNQSTTLRLIQSLSTSVSTVLFGFNRNVASISSLSSQVSYLTLEYSSFITTGVPASVYASFIQLENYSYYIISSMYGSTITYQSTLASQNEVIAKTFFSTYVDSLYESTVSATTQLTMDYISTLFSTYYDIGISTIIQQTNSTTEFLLSTYTSSLLTLLSTTNELYISTATYILNSSITQTNVIYSTYVESTIQVYNNFVNTLNGGGTMSRTTIDLTAGQPVGIMNFSTYRNFEVNVHDIADTTSAIQLTYDPSLLYNLDFARGNIFINIETREQEYTLNGGKLLFDVYRWGIPTSIWENFYPTIANSQYTLQYEYTILRNNIYTNLLAVYPLLFVASLSVNGDSAPKRPVVYNEDPFTVAWTSYNGFNPTNLQGSPPFSPTVTVRMVSTEFPSYLTNDYTYGPFPLNSSTELIPFSPHGNGELVNIIVIITGQQNTNYSQTMQIFFFNT